MTVDALLQLPVRLHGIELGRPVDVILDLDGRALGLDVRCRDHLHRFLPLAAARIRETEIEVRSSLLLLEEAELAFYRRKGHAVGALRGTGVERGGERLGALKDVVLEDDGTIAAVIVEDGPDGRVVPFDAGITFGARRRRLPAA